MFWDIPIEDNKAALWFLGQSGFYLKSCGKTVIIDPYLSDSVGNATPLFTRAYPVPVDPSQIKSDIFITTHDHLDHLDPETIRAYKYQETTTFIAPRNAAKKLKELGIAQDKIVTVDHGDSITIDDVNIRGIFALGTSPDVVDTTGYKIEFPNGKSVYHSSDTSYCNLLIQSCPYADVFLPCINGKFGNLTVEQAVLLTKAVKPLYVIPHHYDVMKLNGEDPEAFKYSCREAELNTECIILKALNKFVW